MDPILKDGELIGTHHFSITVADIDRSLAWYSDVLGLELLSRQRNEAAYAGHLIGMPGAILEVAFLSLPGDHKVALELIEYVRPKGEPVPLRTSTPGVAHIAFRVRDIDAVVVRLAASGVSPVSSPVEIDRGVNRGNRACYLRDLDGFTLELMQPPSV